MFVICFVSFIGLIADGYQLPPISPTTSDADTVYYFTNTSNEFDAGYIECGADKPNCAVQCHADSACANLHINASMTQNLILECDGSYACEYITVYGPNVSV
eukprot:869993_1